VLTAAAMTLLVTAPSLDLDGRTWGVLACAIALTGLVAARQMVALRDNTRLRDRLDQSRAALQQAIAREQVLAEAGTALRGTRERTELYRLATETAVAVLAGYPRAGATILVGTPSTPTQVVAAAGDDTAVQGAELSARLVGRLKSGEVVDCAPSELGITIGIKRETVLLLPLETGGESVVALGVGADTGLPQDVRRALEILRTQVALALGGAALRTELTQRALHDSLTGLANRVAFHDRLQQAVARSRRSGQHTAVLLLDLDGFKNVNDTLGHEAGDHVLKVVAERLSRGVRAGELAARVGGDEFAIIVESLDHKHHVAAVAERVRRVFDAPTWFGGHEVPVRGSVGVAVADGSPDPEQLMREADAAMYRAKRGVRPRR
jgi:diguanylate cyclase (GGDEF)-like protein